MSHHHQGRSDRQLAQVAALNVVITLAQVVGGLISGSLALLSDALHNAGDVLALLVAWWAARLKRRRPDIRYTFGLRRAEILAALFNAAALIGISIYLALEAVSRLANPPPVAGGIVVVLAALGLVVNGLSVWLLHGGPEQDMNRRAALLHLLGDALTSLAVLMGGLAIWFFRLYWIDPALTLAVSAWLLWASWGIVRQAVDVLMMATPTHLSLNEVERALTALPGVEDVHHLHLWQLDGERIHLEAHVRVVDMAVTQADALRAEIGDCLRERFGIEHVTLQFECGSCDAAHVQ